MKIQKLAFIGALALTASLASGVSASAQTVSASKGDLVLSFDLDDSSSSNDLEVDLGSFSTYDAAGYSNSDVVNVANDLATAASSGGFGSNWASLSDLEYGIVGVTSATTNPAKYTIYIANGPGNTIKSLTSQSTVANNLAALVGSLNGAVSTSDNSEATLALNGSDANSFTQEREGGNGSGSTYFGDGNLGNPAVLVDSNSNGITTEELYSLAQGAPASTPPVDIGTFTFNDTTGVLSFQSALATPEPSAYALGICAVVLFLVLKRRRSIA